MSGTTAISSFSMVEAEFLEPKKILKHMRKLCESATEFLDHLAPDNGRLEDDLRHIHEMQKPDSDFTDEYRDFDEELELHLKHYKSEQHSYVHIRAVHRALFSGYHDLAAAQSGLDLVLYLANLLVFAKQMIHSDRSEKEIWDALRQLDNSFPSQFMRSLVSDAEPTTTGDSALLQDTLNLALELRTQLAILVLERSTTEMDFDPDEVLSEVFLRSESSQETGSAIIRGWSIAALGGEDSALPQFFQHLVIERLKKIREFFLLDEESLESGDVVDLEGLGASFPWEATILRLLHWVRLRHRELRAAIEELGGGAAILGSVKQQMEEPQLGSQQLGTTSAPQESPRRKRKSFGERRRTSRKFNPNAEVDVRAIDALKARERLSVASTAPLVQEEQAAEPEVAEEVQDEPPVVEQQQDEYPPVVGAEDQEQPVEPQEAVLDVEEKEHEEEEEEAELEPAGPPTSSAAILKALKKVSKLEKENRAASIFDRQAHAQRIEFGDGFDTQPTPGPSTSNKGKQRAQPSPRRKRPRIIDIESESEEDAFETEDRTARVHERRQKAPVTKKVRIDPASSAAPPSHQPLPRHNSDDDHVPEPEQESVSETEAPDMTEEAPPSTYQDQKKLARQNRVIMAPEDRRNLRKPRTDWTPEAENAFAEYMAMYPCKWAVIQRYDRENGHQVLTDRTQVNLKDKARTMAINMIK
jgi:hypothetical protein